VPLIVPISHHGKKPIKETVIDYHQPWVKNHWNSIQSAYRKAPFFEFYADNIEKILFKKRKYLLDLNHDLLREITSFTLFENFASIERPKK